MNISLTPDTYTPSVDAHGNYIDGKVCIRHGMRCLCGLRQNKVYETNAQFATHTKSKTHQTWLKQLNQNKANYYVDLMKEKETNTTQKQIIARLELSISNKSVTIDYLTQQIMLSKRLVVNGSSVNDLLDIN